MTSLKDYLPADLQPVTVTESMEGVIGMTALNPINRMLQLAGVAPLEETHPAAQQAAIAIAKKQEHDDMEETQDLEEADAAGTSDQLVKVATNLPQYKGNAEAARLYTVGTLLTAVFQNIKQNPPQTTVAQGKVQELSILGAMGADLIKTSQTMMKPQTATPAPGKTMPSSQTPGLT